MTTHSGLSQYCPGHLLVVLISLLLIMGATAESINGTDALSDNSTSSPEQNGSFVVTGTESVLTTATWEANEKHPALWEDRVVWEDMRDYIDEIGEYQADIYYYNISTGEERRLVATAENEAKPDIWGDLVVWQRYDPLDSEYEIMLYNLSTGVLIQLTNDTKNQLFPRVWGNHIVWQDGAESVDAELTITLYDCATGIERTISGDSLYARCPDIWQDCVVWEDGRNGNDLDIFLYNISSGTEMQITTDPHFQTNPTVWDNRVVWEDDRDGPIQVYLYDLESGNESRLTTGEAPHRTPVISGDYTVFVNESEDSGISLIVLPSLDSIVLSPGGSNPDIWGNRVVWQDTRSAEGDIYLYSIGVVQPPLIAGFLVNTTQGPPPLTVAFSDASCGQVDGWTWDFGDGDTSYESNPLHTYSAEGSYTVTLTVHNPWQRDVERKTDLISVGTGPEGQFGQNVTGGPAPLSVFFEDKSSGNPVEWEWSFGDGETSDEKNPIHVYASPGIYSVSLAVTNVFGTSYLEKQDLITVKEGIYTMCIFPGNGIEVNTSGDNTILRLDSTVAASCIYEPDINPTEVIWYPSEQEGIRHVVFSTPGANRFAQEGNGVITGVLGGAYVTSCDIYLSNSNTTELQYYNISLDLPSYSPGSMLDMVAWAGCTPEDFVRFNAIKSDENYAVIEALAATVRCPVDNLSIPGPATLVFAVSSDWVRTYGWADNRTLQVESVPEGARVYIDTVYMGQTPLNTTTISPGSHEVQLVKAGYQTITRTMVVADERDSIHVFRIGDDGTGEVLNTTFIGHDPERNLDFFRADSPNGLSTFGLASLSKSGNIFQLFNLVITHAMSTGGGRGGGGSSSEMSGSAAASAASSLARDSPSTEPAAPNSAEPGKPPAPPGTIQPANPGDAAGPPPATPGDEPGSSPMESLIEPVSSIIILRNLSIVFVVIFIAVVFYTRWKR